jgi:UDP-N-acetylglucosamine 1-carboxyvinyltransferase
MYYPGFPTDMHPPLAALMCYAKGESIIEERVWQHRFRYTEELAKLGAHFEINGRTLLVKPSALQGGDVNATDLRGGAALVVAALGAKGRSVIGKWEYLERGYEEMPKKLRGIGADII